MTGVQTCALPISFCRRAILAASYAASSVWMAGNLLIELTRTPFLAPIHWWYVLDRNPCCRGREPPFPTTGLPARREQRISMVNDPHSIWWSVLIDNCIQSTTKGSDELDSLAEVRIRNLQLTVPAMGQVVAPSGKLFEALLGLLARSAAAFCAK